MWYFIILVAFVLYKKKAKTVKNILFVFDLDLILYVDLGRSYKYFFSIRVIKLYRNRPQVNLNRSITYKGGRFSDIVLLLMTKKYVAQKYPPPLRRVELGDTRYLILQLGEKICLPSRSSKIGHILTKMPWTTFPFFVITIGILVLVAISPVYNTEHLTPTTRTFFCKNHGDRRVFFNLNSS